MNDDFEELKKFCERRGINCMNRKIILFGKGVVFDVDRKVVTVSKNATKEDIKMATEYIKKHY